jgi:hypothetical protein
LPRDRPQGFGIQSQIGVDEARRTEPSEGSLDTMRRHPEPDRQHIDIDPLDGRGPQHRQPNRVQRQPEKLRRIAYSPTPILFSHGVPAVMLESNIPDTSVSRQRSSKIGPLTTQSRSHGSGPAAHIGILAVPMPSQSFRATASTSAPLDAAWSALQRPETWEGIAGVDDITDAAHDEHGHLTGFVFAATVGGFRYPGRSKVIGASPPVHMRLELVTAELTGTIDVRLRHTHARSDVHVELAVRSKSMLAGMFFPAIADTIGRGLPAATDNFAERLAEPS